MMASKHPSPFWNRDAIMAAGMAFAGLAVLQSKLLPEDGRLGTLRSASLDFFVKFFDTRLLHWWPVLLIAGGVAIWIRSAFPRRSTRRGSSAGQGEVTNEHRR